MMPRFPTCNKLYAFRSLAYGLGKFYCDRQRKHYIPEDVHYDRKENGRLSKTTSSSQVAAPPSFRKFLGNCAFWELQQPVHTVRHRSVPCATNPGKSQYSASETWLLPKELHCYLTVKLKIAVQTEAWCVQTLHIWHGGPQMEL